MDFGEALKGLKQGNKVARKGWNGKGMFIYMTSGSIVPVVNLKQETVDAIFGENALLEGDTTVIIQPHIDMKAADGTITIGWNASQVDMQAEDWLLLK